MPDIPVIVYSPLLTEDEIEFLAPLSETAADIGFKFGGTSISRWIALDDDEGRTIYGLSTSLSSERVLTYYNKHEITSGIAENKMSDDVAFKNRLPIEGSFSLRTTLEK